MERPRFPVREGWSATLFDGVPRGEVGPRKVVTYSMLLGIIAATKLTHKCPTPFDKVLYPKLNSNEF